MASTIAPPRESGTPGRTHDRVPPAADPESASTPAAAVSDAAPPVSEFDHPTPPPWRSRVLGRFETPLVWLLGHATRVWPILVLGLVFLATWDALSRVHTHEVRRVLRDIDTGWLGIAALATVANIAVMGLYDVVAFRHTRASLRERWRFGSVAFAWSNFLTLGPLAGPAVRFWLYRPHVDDLAALPGGIASVAVAFVAGLGGWLAAAVIVPPGVRDGPAAMAVVALVLAVPVAVLGRAIVARFEHVEVPRTRPALAIGLSAIGWLDWLIAAVVFAACLRAAGTSLGLATTLRSFFIGQAIGLLSLVPGGLGSSDAFWVTHLPLDENLVTGALVAYRAVYYIVPWAGASLVLLAIAASRGVKQVAIARRVVAGLVGLGGALMLASTASPALQARLHLLPDLVPLPLVELGHFSAAAAGLLLLVIARGLARGYRAALRSTMLLLAVAGLSALLKGLDWEEAVLMVLLAAALASQSALFDRPSHGAWLERRDVAFAAGALIVFVLFGAFTHRVTFTTVERWSHVGYRVEATRFLRTAVGLAFGVAAAGAYVLFRVPVRFSRLESSQIDRAIALHARLGHDSTPLMVANGDKDVFFFGEQGFCLYRTVGPYAAVLSDPTLASSSMQNEFLDAFFAHCAELDRRPLFYQVSLDWIPPLHDRGFDFFKLGEEAIVPLDRFTLEGSAGKLNRQLLRRGERDGLSFRVLPPADVEAQLPALRAVSDDWLQAKAVRERQFSIGFFDEPYLRRFPCAVVTGSGGALVAFANLLEGPGCEELSVDLMRYRADAPRGVMDFLFTALMLHGKQLGYARFNLGMAPLSSVGQAREAHLRERLAHLLFQHGETWYNFQGLRAYKEKFDPVWRPRYMAYERAWEWAAAITHVSALIAGGWPRILRGA